MFLSKKSKYLNRTGMTINYHQWGFVLLLLFTGFLSGTASAADSPTNYKSGISVTFSGTQGVDWDEEVFWYIPEQDDHKVVYIKKETLITMSNNDLNMRLGSSNAFIYDIGADGGGLIRYGIDRDYQIKYAWGENRTSDEVRFPLYEEPFSFDSLTYGTGYADDNSTVPVVGSTGDNGADITDRANYYTYGQLDEFGDEWHTLSFANDDTDLQKSLGNTYAELFASDGKLILFVVDPKTPCVKFAASGNGQYYTTPAKAYYTPKVHSQTTYLTDNVSITLNNIMNSSPCYYRFYPKDNPAGSYIQFTPSAMSSSVSALADDTEYVLEYYYDENYKKRRIIIKNPVFPSENENNGYLLWESDSEFNAVKANMRKAGSLYNEYYVKLRDKVNNEDFDSLSGQGKRYKYLRAVDNAFVARIEGIDHNDGSDSDGSSCAARAKGMLLDNVLTLDDFWLCQGSGTANPCSEIRNRGYYDVDIYFSNTFAYDMLIKHYRSDQYAGGITPVEDYKIRDTLANFAMMSMTTLGEYDKFSSIAGRSGMWCTAREIGGLMVALAMPEYNTPYFGTSGFDGTTASYKYTPFPDQALSWKQVWYTEGLTEGSFPNFAHPFGLHEQITSEPVERGTDSLTLPVGSFTDRPDYYSLALMGHTFHIVANVMKIKFDHEYEFLEKSFENSNNGLLYGLKANSSELSPRYFPQLMLINKRFPDLAQDAADYIESQGTGRNGYSKQMYIAGVYGLIFYDDDWQEEKGNPPVANAGSDQTIDDADDNGNEQVTLNGSDSTDSDGTIESYVWSESGIQIASGISADVVLSVGQHTITLTVTDNDDLTDTDTVAVTIQSVTQTTPTAVWSDNNIYSFNGIDDYIEVPTDDWNVNSGTVSLWAYAEDFSDTRYLFGHNYGDAAWSDRIQLYTGEGMLSLGLGGSHSLNQNIQNLNLRTWYNIILTWDGTNYVVYVEGVERASGTYTGLTDLDGFADIGNTGRISYRDDQVFDGRIGKVSIYSQVLNAQEVSDLYSSAFPFIDDVQTSANILDATITWVTNEGSTSQVDYGLDTGYGISTTLDESLVTSHSVTITGLSADTTYHYRVKSKDSSDNETVSSDYTFTTSPAANQAPVANNDTAALAEDSGSNTINVLANDSDAEDDTLTIISVTQGSHGTVGITGSGTDVTYTPAANYNGSDSFTYTISDGSNTNTATVNVTVTGVNDAPNASNDSATVAEDSGANTVNVLANDGDIDGDTLVITAITQGLHGTVAISGGGSNLTYTPVANYDGSDSFTYTISDGSNTDTAMVSITVTGVNDSPVLTMIPSAKSMTEGQVLSSADIELATDPDGDSLTYTYSGLTNKLPFTFDYDSAGMHTLNVSVSDGEVTVSKNVTLVVSNINRDPELTMLPSFLNLNEGQTLAAVDIELATDPDDDSLTYSYSGFTNALPFTFDYNSAGVYSLNVSVSDGTATVNKSIAIAVANTNRQPVAVDDIVTMDEDVVFTTDNLIDNDTDEDGDTLTIETFTQPVNCSLVYNNDGTFTCTPDENFNGTDTFTYTVSDGDGGTDNAEVAIMVNSINDAPVISDKVITGKENTVSVITFDVTDVENDTITMFWIASLPDNGQLIFDGSTVSDGINVFDGDQIGMGYLVFKPDTSFNGTTEFYVKAYDGTTWSNDATITIDVQEDLTAPVIELINSTKFSVNVQFDEALDQTSAENTANYSLGEDIIVVNAALNTSSNTVSLLISGHEQNGKYTLTVHNIADIEANYMNETSIQYNYNSDLAGFWEFEELSGNKVFDSSGNINTGNLINSVSLTGKGDVNFNDIDGAIEISTSDLNITGGAVMMWMYSEDITGSRYLFGHGVDSANWIQLYTNDGELGLGLGDSQIVDNSIETIQPKVWYHLAVIWDENEYLVYIDGIETTNGTFSGLSNLNTRADIGNTGEDSDRTKAFNGYIDDVRIYSRALTEDEVLDVFFNTENRDVISFTLTGADQSGTDLTYILQDPDTLPSGAVFDSNTGKFEWKPWYNQAGSYDIIFTVSDNAQYTQIVTINVEEIELSSRHQEWLEYIGKL